MLQKVFMKPNLDLVMVSGYKIFAKNTSVNCRSRSGDVLVAVKDKLFEYVKEVKCSYENGINLRMK